MLSVKEGCTKYHFFFSFWYGSTTDWTLVTLTIGERSTHSANLSITASGYNIEVWDTK